jgi:pyruvate dehydrogenase E1 component beta subunit|tara:strand:- start:2185 stop:3165 length:981 start_codon:yes stop_codon:yes gene_type:complete
VAQLTYREAVSLSIAQCMRKDEKVLFLGEDVGAAGGVFKATVGLLEEFGSVRVKDTPISEQAILGAAMGASMVGLKPIAEIMFSDFLAVCWDIVANEIAKTRYMSDGQINLPLVIRTANGAGSKFGAQHSQSLENWSMAVPGLKVVAPSCPSDVIGLMTSSVADPDPVIFYEHKSLYPMKEEIEDTNLFINLGEANIMHEGSDACIISLGLMAQRSKEAALILKNKHKIKVSVLDLRTLVPLDLQTIKREVKKSGLVFTVEENPRLCGWGSEISSIIVEQLFSELKGPITRITTPHIPLPSADILEDNTIPTTDLIVEKIIKQLKK